MKSHFPAIALFGAFALSLANCLAAAFGLAPALGWVTGLQLWGGVTVPLTLVGLGWLAYSWVNTLMGNRAGMAIYGVNLLLAPFGYGLIGLPWALGAVLALAPVPFYLGLRWMAD